VTIELPDTFIPVFRAL